MVIKLLNSVNRVLTHEDFGKFLLRLAVGGLMLFHGLHKLFAGIDGISGMLIAKGFPGFIAYGVLLGEVVAPCLIILGILTRPAALGLAFTMVVAWLMVGMGETGHWIKPVHGRLKVWCISSSARWPWRFGAGRYSVAGNSARR